MATIIETPRLRLRLWTPEDVDAGVAIWGDAQVMRHLGDPPLDAAAVARVIAAGRAHYERHGVQHFAVERRADGRVLGACGFNVAEDGAELELVYHFARDAWGRGYASEAARACVEWAAATRAPVTIVASAARENLASFVVMQRCGLAWVEDRWFDDTQRFEPWHRRVIGAR